MKSLTDQWHFVVLDIAVINEFRLGGSKHISNFESGLQENETCFFLKNGYLSMCGTVLLAGIVLQKHSMQYWKCKLRSEVEWLRLTWIIFKDPVRTAQ